LIVFLLRHWKRNRILVKNKIDWEVAMWMVLVMDIRDNLSSKDGPVKEPIKQFSFDTAATLPVEVVKFHDDFFNMNRDTHIEDVVLQCLAQKSLVGSDPVVDRMVLERFCLRRKIWRVPKKDLQRRLEIARGLIEIEERTSVVSKKRRREDDNECTFELASVARSCLADPRRYAHALVTMYKLFNTNESDKFVECKFMADRGVEIKMQRLQDHSTLEVVIVVRKQVEAWS